MNSGPVSCRVSLDRGGYVAGETIGISATIVNKSKVTIKSTKASLTEVRNILSLTHARISFHLLSLLLLINSFFRFVVADHSIYGQRKSYLFGN